MIKPVNGHLLIEPLEHKSFISQEKGIYEEIGIVLALNFSHIEGVKVGDKVYFDSYLAAKYPKNDKEWFWLVRWEDVRAIEQNDEISK